MIGITGGIGSGKSTIAHELAQRGYTVYDCDREAKRIITENPEVRKAIIDLLGEEAFAGGTYNTAYVAQRVFENSSLREALNAIVHPAVKADIIKQARLASFGDPVTSFHHAVKRLLFIESAILYEAGLDSLCDKIIVVEAPEDIRIARTIARDYKGETSPENINKVRARMRTQAPHEGDIRVDNDGNTPVENLVAQLLQNL